MRRLLFLAPLTLLALVGLVLFTVFSSIGASTATVVAAEAAGVSPVMDGGLCAGPKTAGMAGGRLAAAAAVRAGFTGDDVTVAVAVAKAESGWVPTATNLNSNDSTDYGVWQINSVHAPILAQGDWRDAFDNGVMAYKVWADAGNSWTPWVTFNSGSHLLHMDEARSLVAGLSAASPRAPPDQCAVSSGTRGSLVAFGRRLQGLGFRVGEHPLFGGVNPVHAKNSWHDRDGGAIDVNYDGHAETETAAINRAVPLAKQYGLRTIWQYPGHYDHGHFDIDPGTDLGSFPGSTDPDPPGSTGDHVYVTPPPDGG